MLKTKSTHSVAKKTIATLGLFYLVFTLMVGSVAHANLVEHDASECIACLHHPHNDLSATPEQATVIKPTVSFTVTLSPLSDKLENHYQRPQSARAPPTV